MFRSVESAFDKREKGVFDFGNAGIDVETAKSR
jgi:hypothetical protein